MLKNWCFRTVVLMKTLEIPLYCKEIQLVHPKGAQSWVFIEDWCWSWNSIPLATWYKELTHLKRPWCRERLKAGEGDDRGWDGWIAPPDGFAFKQAPGGGEGQGAWCVVVHQVSKNQTWTTTTKKTIEVPWRRFGTNLSIPCSANEIASIRRNRWFIRLETSSRFCN